MTFVKICGITNLEDALQAVAAGADALGFNFYLKSPRYVAPETANAIISGLPSRIVSVGVFVNEPIDQTIAIAARSGIGEIQLHGEETPEQVREVASRSELPVIKAFGVNGGFDLGRLENYESNAVLLDGFSSDGHGGTGVKTDWDMARTVVLSGRKVFLAGGLSAENVGDAVAAVSPFAVDACSLLESTKGKKDPEKVRRFIENAKKA